LRLAAQSRTLRRTSDDVRKLIAQMWRHPTDESGEARDVVVGGVVAGDVAMAAVPDVEVGDQIVHRWPGRDSWSSAGPPYGQ
jgi:hypothetical protein